MSPAPEALEQAFLDDVVAHPDDPSLWLILADWLDEREDPRAELVRLTWQLQYESDHADFASRQARVQALLAGGMKPVRPRCTLDGIDFAWVPPGTFLMGSPRDEPERGEDEKQHRVTLTAAFWMGVYPVTQAQWRAVMGDNPSAFTRNGRSAGSVEDLSDADLDRFPVESLTWDQAQEFCTNLSSRLGRRIRLPTEAQWEYACRAGTTSPFHFGSVLAGHEATCDGSVPYCTTEVGPNSRHPTPVGLPSHPPNAWGLCDMHGNVWEMCRDAYRKTYHRLPGTDPLHDPPSATRRVLRGGSWGIRARWCRSTDRHTVSHSGTSSGYGFRVCCLD
jgi:uncharacterized protein (TIGR02996 family)